MEKPVIYVKLPIYVQQFIRQRYCKGGADCTEPITLNHELHPAGILLYRKVDSNPLLEPWTTLSLSEQAYELCDLVNSTAAESLPTELQGLTRIMPSSDNKRFFAPFAIRPEHSYNGRLVPSDKTAQLRAADAKEFRYIIFKEFWDDYDSFRKEWDTHPDLRGGAKLEDQSAIIEYMMRRDIDLDYEDALSRVIRRRKHNAIVRLECRE